MAPMMDCEDRNPRRQSPGRTANFDVRPASIEDVRRLVDIEFHAFEHERVNHVLSYRDHHNPDHLERSVKGYTALLDMETTTLPSKTRGSSLSEGDSHEVNFLKVMDRGTGELVSFAKTEVKQYTEEELFSPADIGHESEAQMNRDWFALNERTRREYMGLREHCYIGMLATQPQHQHHGAGTLLLNAILADADRRGVECYLEATDTAKPLYDKHGFRTITELRFDPTAYGIVGLGIERQTVMVRGALDTNGVRQEPKSWDAVHTHTGVSMEHHPVLRVTGRL